MGIRRFVISTTEAVKRNAPNATPAKNACRYAAAAFTKIAKLVKNTCRNSYNFASAAVAKITHTVRNILLRRLARRMAADDTNGTYEKISADEVEGLNATLVKTNSCSCSCSFGFLTFAKIGYTVRVKIVYRIVQWISDDGNKFILDQDFGMPVKNEGMNFFAKIVHDVKKWMACPDTKSRFIMYDVGLFMHGRN